MFRSRKLGLALLLLAVTAGVLLYARGIANSEAEASRIAELLGLSPGMTVAEIGAGEGRMTVGIARRLGPGGHMFSTELNPARLRDIQEAVAKAGLTNVTAVRGEERKTNLPERCCDAIFMRDVYHHFTDPAAMDASLLESLRPGGLLAIVDFVPRVWLFWLRRPAGVPENRGGHGVPQRILIEEATRAGFLFDRAIDTWGHWPKSYCIVFRKPVMR